MNAVIYDPSINATSLPLPPPHPLSGGKEIGLACVKTLSNILFCCGGEGEGFENDSQSPLGSSYHKRAGIYLKKGKNYICPNLGYIKEGYPHLSFLFILKGITTEVKFKGVLSRPGYSEVHTYSYYMMRKNGSR